MADIGLVHNFSENIKTIEDFVNFRCSDGKNVFVRLIGEDNNFLKDISQMDRMLSKSGKYVRIRRLNSMISPNEAENCNLRYEEWLRGFKKKAITEATKGNEELSMRLGGALEDVLSVFKRTRPQISPSIEKNFIVKLLFWFDELAENAPGSSFDVRGMKIVCDNVLKVQEYLFFYMIAVMGASVLLLQNKDDIDDKTKELNLSKRYVIGHLGNSVIPEYQTYSVSAGNSVSVQPIPRPRESFGGTPPAFGNPPVPNARMAPPSAVKAPSNAPTVKIPPRPGRNRSSDPLNGFGSGQYPNRNNTRSENNFGSSSPYSFPNRNRSPQPTDNYRPQQQGRGVSNGDRSFSYGSPSVRIPPHPDRGNTFNNPAGSYGAMPRSFIPQPSFASNNTNREFVGETYRDGQVRIMGGNTVGVRREKSFEELANLASSVVQIFVMNRHDNIPSNNNLAVESMGSGVMIGRDGYIVTNHHVISDGRVYGVRIENDQQIYFTDQLVKYHRDFDLAVIKIDRKLEPIPVFNDPKGLVRGQKVVAIGSPHGLFNTVSDGIISGFRNVDGIDMIQFTAPVSPGSSGGALLNMYGELIGISRMIRNDAQNINLAVGYDMIINFCKSFM